MFEDPLPTQIPRMGTQIFRSEPKEGKEEESEWKSAFLCVVILGALAARLSTT